MTTVADEYQTTKAWIERAARYWGTDVDDYREQLPVVLKFCAELELDPDALIASCMKTKPDGRRVATMAAVRKYWKLVRAFGIREGDSAAAIVMSFFIYNGVLMQCPGAEP